MKYTRVGEKVISGVKIRAAEWRLFDALLMDLGMKEDDVPNLDSYKPRLTDMQISKDLVRCVRQRDIKGLLHLQEQLQPRCIIAAQEGEEMDASVFYALYQAGSFLKKFPFEDASINRRGAALDKFTKTEHRCKLFNSENHKALLRLNEDHPDYFGVLDEIRQDIEWVIGSEPNTESIGILAQHGPGVSLSKLYKGGKVTSYYKWSLLPYSVTIAALPHAQALISADPRWIGALQDRYRRETKTPMWCPIDLDSFWDWVFVITEASKITTVPKTVLTDRTIAIEPLLNVFMQLGVDGFIRPRLKARWGYDLDDQEHNQELARLGSIDGTLATLDLSAASDTVSLKICELLLPPMWYDYLLDLRCVFGFIDESLVTFEKISSMGNGYTFVLESLIFGALVRAAIRRTSSVHVSAVYGDDLIVPTTAVSYLTSLLELSGFKLNYDKSFSDGPFRESCGKDYVRGMLVRPVFLKDRIEHVTEVFYIHNIFYAQTTALPWFFGFTFQNLLQLARRWTPADFEQFRGPVGEVFDSYLFDDQCFRKMALAQLGSLSDMEVPYKTLAKALTLRRRVFWRLRVRARQFSGREFFFRKLMVSLVERPPRKGWLDKKRMTSNSGNAFDVTRRDAVTLVTQLSQAF